MAGDYGSTSTILTRTGAEPESFGFEDADNPQEELESFVDDLRERASSEVERFCDRVFGHYEEHIDVLEGNGRRTINTRNYPVTEIHSITIGRDELDENEYQLVASPSNPTENSGRIERLRRPWPPARDIEIVYDWGYEEPPKVVDGVVEDMVFEALERSFTARESSGKQSESMDGYSVSWNVNDVGDHLQLTESMQKRLRPLTRQGVA